MQQIQNRIALISFFDRNMEAGKSKIVEAVWWYRSRRYPREEADGGKLAEWQLELMDRAMRWEKARGDGVVDEIAEGIGVAWSDGEHAQSPERSARKRRRRRANHRGYSMLNGESTFALYSHLIGV